MNEEQIKELTELIRKYTSVRNIDDIDQILTICKIGYSNGKIAGTNELYEKIEARSV
jgi:hypothetical protein